MLGTIAYETDGLSVADGFLRLLGSGSKRSLLRTAELVGRQLNGNYPDVILMGDDVLGGSTPSMAEDRTRRAKERSSISRLTIQPGRRSESAIQTLWAGA